MHSLRAQFVDSRNERFRDRHKQELFDGDVSTVTMNSARLFLIRLLKSLSRNTRT